LNARPFSLFSFLISAALALGLVLLVVSRPRGQGTATPLTLLAREGRRTMSVGVINDQEFVALDDLAAVFQLAVHEDSLGAITVAYKGRTVVLTPDQAIASVSGRLISLPAPPSRAGRRWMVPVEFISRALAPIYDVRLDLRKPSHLLVVGNLRVPRVSIRHEPLTNAVRLTLDATPRTASTVVQDSERLRVTFDADALDVTIPAFQPQGLVQAVRSVDPVTLAVELGPRFAAFRTSTQSLDTTTRLVLDLVATQTQTPSPAPATSPPAAVPSEAPIFGRPASAIRTIAIDPGHGGEDEGAKGAGGTTEKNVTLAVARRVKAAVEGQLGIRVLLTRDEDRRVPIDERPAVANNNKADLFISLHASASPKSATSGASIYVAAFTDTDQARVALAPERVPTFGGGSRDIEFVLWDLAQIRHIDQSAELARLLEQQFDDRVPLGARPFDRAPLRVLESANMPAVLIEMGYLTNADEEKRLASSNFQNAFVQAVLDAVLKFRDYLGAATGGTR